MEVDDAVCNFAFAQGALANGHAPSKPINQSIPHC